MNYPIPTTTEEITALGWRNVDEEIIVAAIAGVINIARGEGQSLKELTEEVLREDELLDPVQRQWLSRLVAEAWNIIPETSVSLAA